MSESWKRRLCGVMLALLVQIVYVPSTAVRAQSADTPSVGGIQLTQAAAGPVALFHDPDVDPQTVEVSQRAIIAGLDAVPRMTGLPPFATPVRAFVLKDDERFRLALAEIASVRVDLVSEDIGGYTIERDGVMLVFFGEANVADPANALLGFAHELAHLAVREATQRRAVPQWFNEGYASWIANQIVAERYPAATGLQDTLDRLSVASALHTRGLIPWADLVTRTRFSRAGVDGLVGLAYGQSTLFIDFLAARHGPPALARFLTSLGEGSGATQAFAGAFGPFAGQVSAFEASLAALKDDLQPGLYVLRPATDDAPAVFGVVGGPSLETAVVRVQRGEEVVRRRELDLDGSGLVIFSLPKSLLDDGAVIRVTLPMLGELELDPATQVRALPNRAPVTPFPQRPSPTPVPAPAQVPAA